MFRGGGAGGAGGGTCPPCFGDLFSKFWEFLKIHFLLLTDAPHEEFASANPALDKKDSELLMFIFEFSSPKIFVEPAQSILSDLSGDVDMDIGNTLQKR